MIVWHGCIFLILINYWLCLGMLTYMNPCSNIFETPYQNRKYQSLGVQLPDENWAIGKRKPQSLRNTGELVLPIQVLFYLVVNKVSSFERYWLHAIINIIYSNLVLETYCIYCQVIWWVRWFTCQVWCNKSSLCFPFLKTISRFSCIMKKIVNFISKSKSWMHVSQCA